MGGSFGSFFVRLGLGLWLIPNRSVTSSLFRMVDLHTPKPQSCLTIVLGMSANPASVEFTDRRSCTTAGTSADSDRAKDYRRFCFKCREVGLELLDNNHVAIGPTPFQVETSTTHLATRSEDVY